MYFLDTQFIVLPIIPTKKRHPDWKRHKIVVYFLHLLAVVLCFFVVVFCLFVVSFCLFVVVMCLFVVLCLCCHSEFSFLSVIVLCLFYVWQFCIFLLSFRCLFVVVLYVSVVVCLTFQEEMSCPLSMSCACTHWAVVSNPSMNTLRKLTAHC